MREIFPKNKGVRVLFLVFLSLIFSSPILAKKLSVEIMAVDGNGDGYLIFTDSGEIFETHDEKIIEVANNAMEMKVAVSLITENTDESADILGVRNTILKISLLSEPSQTKEESLSKNLKSYNPKALMSTYVTNFESESETQGTFLNMRTRMRRRSQCYNRAHVWAWELHQGFYNNQRVQVGKMWLFFTRKYIRAYKYKWWFHIAPYVNQADTTMVMDRKFATAAVETKVWTDIFMYNDAPCKEVRRYSDYRENQQSEECYLIKTSQYYWQPWQIEKLETEGIIRDQWETYPLQKAYRNGIGRRARVPSL